MPKMNVLAWTTLDDGGIQTGESVAAAYGREFSGYRFEVSNESESIMAPARFSASGLEFANRPSDGEPVGFDTASIVISALFLARATAPSLTLHTLEGDVVISQDELAHIAPDEAGDVVVRMADVAPDKHLTGFDIDMEAFAEVAADERASAFVEVAGVPRSIDSFTMNARFSTAYPDSLGLPPVGVDGSARIDVVAPKPVVCLLYTSRCV